MYPPTPLNLYFIAFFNDQSISRQLTSVILAEMKINLLTSKTTVFKILT